ncbi:MAG TPA: response regulator [Dehalococcoidales bacterium]|nr:response regulator [Dehalococcoidales bacterium]
MIKKPDGNIVLLIEDDADIRTFACRVLELEGYICLQAETGDEAFKLIMGNKVNLVLLDLRLAENNGWMILKKLKKDAETSPIPVIVFTASFGEQQRASALKMGAADYLIKPLSANVLRDAVACVLPLKK